MRILFPSVCFSAVKFRKPSPLLVRMSKKKGSHSVSSGKEILHLDKRPKFIAFDLDCTMWPFHVDTHVDLPFKRKGDGKIYDVHGYHIRTFPDVDYMLKTLYDRGYKLGLASRTTEIQAAKTLVKMFHWEEMCPYREIYPGSKISHFNRFHEATGIEYKDMLFFDDEYRNVVDVSKLGVTCIFAEDGMSINVLNQGLKEYAEKRS